MSLHAASATLLLASASPRRRELLTKVGLPLDVCPADVDETNLPGEDPAAYVLRVTLAKLAAIAAPERWVLAADTTVTIDGQILGKAADDDEARAMLRSLRGRPHQVFTAFALRAPARLGGEVTSRVVTSGVDMSDYPDELIEQYLASGEWRGKAGAYAIQGIGAALVAGVRGSVTNVVGLPLAEVVSELLRRGGPQPHFAAGRPE